MPNSLYTYSFPFLFGHVHELGDAQFVASLLALHRKALHLAICLHEQTSSLAELGRVVTVVAIEAEFHHRLVTDPDMLTTILREEF